MDTINPRAGATLGGGANTHSMSWHKNNPIAKCKSSEVRSGLSGCDHFLRIADFLPSYPRVSLTQFVLFSAHDDSMWRKSRSVNNRARTSDFLAAMRWLRLLRLIRRGTPISRPLIPVNPSIRAPFRAKAANAVAIIIPAFLPPAHPLFQSMVSSTAMPTRWPSALPQSGR